MIKSQKGMKIRLNIQIRVNIPFIYKQDYLNIITELGAIICCQDFPPFFIDKKTKKRLISSIPCKRKKIPTLYTWVHWCATKKWEEWAKVTRCNVFSKQWGTNVRPVKFDTVGVFCIVQRKHINNHVQTSALHLNILSMANSYP